MIHEYQNFKKCIPWLPKRCYLSNKLLWLKPCYRAQWKYDPHLHIWMSERELIIYRLNE